MDWIKKATERNALRFAWQKIRSNGLLSSAEETRIAVAMFGQDAERNLGRIQKRVRSGEFDFEPQKGVLKKKNGGGKRGIVMASVHNRVVERALLDCLQNNSHFVKRVNNHPASVGGVPNRSVPHGLKLIRDAFAQGKRAFVRSDISGFFDNVPRDLVLKKLAENIPDQKFMALLDAATTVILSNETELGENRKVFPVGDDGVAQGSPLSPLFGNILLHDFDQEFNGRGISCVRFIDDFILLGNNEKSVAKAFQNAKAALQMFGMNCHDPFAERNNKEKAAYGAIEDGFVFLGYDIRPGLFQPSKKARQKLESTVDSHLRSGRKAIAEVRNAESSFENRQRYAQTLTLIDKVVRGWGEAFSYGNATNSIDDLDRSIDKKLGDFRSWFARQLDGKDWKAKRRMGGVCLLGDIVQKDLDDVPFVIEKGARFSTSKSSVKISTDGSVAIGSLKKGRDKGPGGWAFVIHGTGQEHSGREPLVTNNQMELRAVIEAIQFVDPANSIFIETDSQYVANAINKQTTIKSNAALWREYRALSNSRRIKIVWVKGHAGDPYNERADKLAKEKASAGAAVKNTTHIELPPSR